MKRAISFLLVLCTLFSLGFAVALEKGDARAVFGADISEAQKEQVYKEFGIKEGSVKELTVTNAEEKEYLDGLVAPSIIGTRAISCVYIEVLGEGEGLKVSTSNISWCTKEMYMNALVTAGIDDAKLIVASPIEGISGTAALTGVYKAYEDITGQQLDETAKLAGTQELVITAELADEIGNYDAVTIVNELKKILAETVKMSDDELREQIKSIAAENNVSVSDSQVEQLVSLCRSLEKLDSEELKAKVESLQTTVKKLAQAKEKASKFAQSFGDFVKSVGKFFSDLFGNIGK